MNDVTSSKKSRRDFLKNASKTTLAVGVGGIALSACSSPKPQEGVAQGRSKKQEILYRSTKQWVSYYESAK